MTILRILLLFIVIGSGILFLIRKLSVSQFLAPFITVAGITVVLYSFALVNLLKPGLVITVAALLILGILSFLDWPIKKKAERTKIQPPLAAWMVIFFVIAVYSAGTFFYQWDEFSYWGAIYRYLMATNHLPDLASNFSVTVYPPFTALFQYFTGTILKNSESSAYFGHLLLSFSAIIAILPNKKWGDWKKYVPALCLITLSVFAFDLRFQSLYVDLSLGLFFAAGLASAFFNDDLSTERLLSVILASVALTLTKPLGFTLAVIPVGILYIDVLVKRFQGNSLKSIIKSLFAPLAQPKIIILIGITLLAYLSWSIHTRPFNNTKVNVSFNANPVTSEEIYPGDITTFLSSLNDQQILYDTNVSLLNQPKEIDISLVSILRVFTANNPYQTRLLIHSYIQSFSVNTFLTVKFTCLTALLFILFVTLFIRITTSPNEHKTNTLSRNTLILLVGFVIYNFALLFAYIFYFPPADAIKTPEVGRYLSSYLLGWWMLIVCVLHEQKSLEIPWIKVQASSFVTVGLLFCFVYMIPFPAYVHSPNSASAQRFEINRIYKAVGGRLTGEDKVFDVWQSDLSYGLNHFIMKYLLTPVPSNIYGWRLSPKSLAEDKTEDQYGILHEMSPEEWLKLLNDQHYTYVLISSSDEGFWDDYGVLFDTFEDKNVAQLFAVTPTGLTNVPIQVKY